MELWDAIRGRRSVRAYTNAPVGRETLDRLIEAALWAPTGGNAQTWRFIVVTEPARLARLRVVSPGLLGDPPAVIAVCADLHEARRLGSTLGETFLAPTDAAMAAENVLLAAWAEGLGTCVIASFHRAAAKRLLELHNGVEPLLLVSVGHPAVVPEPPIRRRSDVVFYEVQG